MKMIAYCGLDCGACPARTATLLDDNDLRRKTSEEWSRLYEADIPPESINCTGCTGDGVKFHYCEHGCEIRKCAVPRNIPNCGSCSEYPCGKIECFFEIAPDAKSNLEG